MGSINFFKTEADAVWGGTSAVFDTDLMDAIARGQADLADDLHVAQALARLVHDELRSFGTGENNSLTDEQMAKALRALRSVLRRLDIDFQPPFRDFTGFRDHWSRQGMSGGGGYAARRGYLHELFEPVWTALDDAEVEATSDAICGVDGELKNIIFASSGPKPEIILRDAISNIIEIVKYEESCLVYDRPLTESGLTWGELVSWWGTAVGSGRNSSPTWTRRMNSTRGSWRRSPITRQRSCCSGRIANVSVPSPDSQHRPCCRRSTCISIR